MDNHRKSCTKRCRGGGRCSILSTHLQMMLKKREPGTQNVGPSTSFMRLLYKIQQGVFARRHPLISDSRVIPACSSTTATLETSCTRFPSVSCGQFQNMAATKKKDGWFISHSYLFSFCTLQSVASKNGTCAQWDLKTVCIKREKEKTRSSQGPEVFTHVHDWKIKLL